MGRIPLPNDRDVKFILAGFVLFIALVFTAGYFVGKP
jgi:hypothetical protein